MYDLLWRPDTKEIVKAYEFLGYVQSMFLCSMRLGFEHVQYINVVLFRDAFRNIKYIFYKNNSEWKAVSYFHKNSE